MDKQCIHCLKKLNTKYETKKIKTPCGHHKLYHYHCYMELCKNVINSENKMCCFHCKEINDIFVPIIFVKKTHKKKICNKIITLTSIFNNKENTQFDRIILLKKIFCLIENNIQYFKNNEKFSDTTIRKIDELLELIQKKPHYDIGINIKSQALYLKTLFKKKI